MTKTRLTAIVSIAVVLGMLGLAFASKPLYDAFCKITGFGGTTRIATAPPSAVLEREMVIRFDANVNGLPIEFSPETAAITVKVGQNNLAFYRVTNTSDYPVTAVATYNVTPHKAGIYFSKLECFCFTDRVFQPGETVTLPVVFFVDPQLDEDRNLKDVTSIMLSYTFFASEKPQAAAKQPVAVSDRS